MEVDTYHSYKEGIRSKWMLFTYTMESYHSCRKCCVSIAVAFHSILSWR